MGPCPFSRRAFTLIELMVVLAIVGTLLTVALPSWRSLQDRATENEARVVLQRLALAQRAFWQRYQRYAMSSELPALENLSRRIAQRYQLRVSTESQGFTLQLLSRTESLPSLELSHLGMWREIAHLLPDKVVTEAPELCCSIT
ncbi:MAG: hypothetical protein CME58_06485 [Halieaceae bacterium]|nr:hypothetical protein [Halieaceae bacterium]